MAKAVRFVIRKITHELYWMGSDAKDLKFTARVEKAKLLKTYEEAEAELDNCPKDNFYQIDKVFKIK